MFENVHLIIKFSPIFCNENQVHKFIEVHEKKFVNWLKAYRMNQNPELEFVFFHLIECNRKEIHVSFLIDVKNIGGLGYPSFSFISRLTSDLESDTLENSYLIQSISFSIED